jgi:hypothetical protein
VDAVYRIAPEAVIALVLVALTASCGGDNVTGPVDERNSGGTGNQTLLVEADVNLEMRTGGFQATFVVDVRDESNDPVSGADVTIVYNHSTVTLQETGDPGVYTAQRSGAASGDLRLEVVKDDMYVRNVTLGNIGIHAILEPQPDDTVPANQPLTIRWASDREAPFAQLTSRTFDFEVADDGEFVVPADDNDPRTNQWIEIERSNEVMITSGLSGSYFRMEVQARIEDVTVIDAL